jgi:hypothetical protein
VRAFNACAREQAHACGAPSREADPVRGRGGPSSDADLARGGEHPLDRGGIRPREERTLERGDTLFEGVFEWAAWWAAGAFASWAMSCMVK